MPTPTLTHKVTVTPHHGPTTGRTYQAHCTCNYRSPHVPTTHRANQIAEEHAARTGGMLQMMRESEQRHSRADSLIDDLKRRVSDLENRAQ